MYGWHGSRKDLGKTSIDFASIDFKKRKTFLSIGGKDSRFSGMFDDKAYIFQYIPGEGSLVKVGGEIIFVYELKGVDGQRITRNLDLIYAGLYSYETLSYGVKTVHSFFDRDDFVKLPKEFYEDYSLYTLMSAYDERYNEGKLFKEQVYPILEAKSPKQEKNIEQRKNPMIFKPKKLIDY